MADQRPADEAPDRHRDDHDAEHGGHEPPPPLADPNVGAGVSTGVWVTGLLIVVLLLLAIFGLGQ